MFDLAAKAVASGYRISRPELEEATGYALEGLQTPSEGGLPGFAGSPSAGYADYGVAKPLQNARSASRGENPIPDARTPLRGDFGHDAATRALAADMQPLADRLRAILAQPEETWADAFAALAEEMPELLQDSDALAELMEEEMARAIANSAAQHCPNCGAFLNGDGTCSNPGCGSGTKTPPSKQHFSQKAKYASTQHPGGRPGSKARRFVPPSTLAANPAPKPSYGENSPYVRNILSGPLRKITEAEADKILSEGFKTKAATGETLHWGVDLVNHIDIPSHPQKDRQYRKGLLLYAIDATRRYIPQYNHRGVPGRLCYKVPHPLTPVIKKTKSGKIVRQWILVLAGPKHNVQGIKTVFDIIPNGG